MYMSMKCDFMLSEFRLRQLDSLTTFITVTILDIFIDFNAPFAIWDTVISSVLRSWQNLTAWHYCLYFIRVQMSWILCLLSYLLDSYNMILYYAINQTYFPFHKYSHMHVALLKFYLLMDIWKPSIPSCYKYHFPSMYESLDGFKTYFLSWSNTAFLHELFNIKES